MSDLELFGVAWAALLMAAASLSWPGIVIVARGQVMLAIAASQMAACGAAAAMFLIGLTSGEHLHGDLRIHAGALFGGLIGTAIAWQGSPERAGWLFAASSAATLILVADSPYGMHDIVILQHSNALTANALELSLFSGTAVTSVLAVCCYHRTLRLLAIDPDHASRCGIPLRTWNIILGTWLGIVLSLAVSSFGLLFTFTCLIAPALAAARLSPTLWPLFFLTPLLALFGSLGGIYLGHAYDLPTGQTAAGFICSLLPIAMFVAWIKKIVRSQKKTDSTTAAAGAST